MTARLNKAQILAAQDLKSEDILVEAWQGVVRVRELSAAERVRVTNVYTENPTESTSSKVERAQAILLTMACIDDAGEPMFSESDIPALLKKNADAIQTLTQAAMRMAGLDSKEKKEADGGK